MATNDRKVIKEITRRFPNCTEESLRKGWLKARGWKSASELMVREDFRFFEGPAVIFVTVDETYRISAGKFERLPSLDIRRVRELRDVPYLQALSRSFALIRPFCEMTQLFREGTSAAEALRPAGVEPTTFSSGG